MRLFYHEAVQSFKPDAILRATWVTEPRGKRYALAAHIQSAAGVLLLEGSKYLGPVRAEEVEILATRMVLEWALELRFEKVHLELGFMAPFPRTPGKGSPEHKELGRLWDQFRLKELKESVSFAPEHPLPSLARAAHPVLRKKER